MNGPLAFRLRDLIRRIDGEYGVTPFERARRQQDVEDLTMVVELVEAIQGAANTPDDGGF